jgi:hypothetical protein
MASRIVPTNIDGMFPVAGQDNSSQGFRDNFTNIKNNFTFARNEIGDLQSKAILTQPLEGSALNNDMAGTQLIRPQLKAWTQALIDLGSISGTAAVSFSVGNFQKITASGAVTLALSGWPSVGTAGGYGVVRVWVVVEAASYGAGTRPTLTLPTSVSIGVNDISGYSSSTNTITFDTDGNYIFDFSSIDGGLTYFIADPMRNRSTLRGNTSVTGNLTVVNATVSSRSSVVITGNTAGAVLLPQNNGVMMHITGQENYPGRFYLDAQGNTSVAGHSHYAAFVGRRYNGNVGVPSAVNSGDIVARFGSTPYHGNTTVNSGWPTITTTRIDMLADENQTVSNIGSRLEFYTTNTQTTTAVKKLTINTAGIVANANLFVSNTFVPTSSTSGGAAGQISYDSGNVYICLGPNNWKRSALSSF